MYREPSAAGRKAHLTPDTLILVFQQLECIGTSTSSRKKQKLEISTKGTKEGDLCYQTHIDLVASGGAHAPPPISVWLNSGIESGVSGSVLHGWELPSIAPGHCQRADDLHPVACGSLKSCPPMTWGPSDQSPERRDTGGVRGGSLYDPMNLPNYLTFARILMVPILVVVLMTKVQNHEIIGVLVFWIASITDLLDGYLARRWKQVTTLGKLLDPLADKLLVSGALISLVELDLAPAWMVFIILAREMAITGLRGIASEEGITIAADTMGKWKMGAQIASISCLILGPKLDGWLFLWTQLRDLPVLHPAQQALQLLRGHGRPAALGRHDPGHLERRLLLPRLLEAAGLQHPDRQGQAHRTRTTRPRSPGSQADDPEVPPRRAVFTLLPLVVTLWILQAIFSILVDIFREPLTWASLQMELPAARLLGAGPGLRRWPPS